MTVDGKKQRNALTAAEQALRALGAGNPDRARANAAKAAELDQIGAFAGFPPAIEDAADRIETEMEIPDATWDALADAVGPGPLAFLVTELRGDG
jgi:hypothetical protein